MGRRLGRDWSADAPRDDWKIVHFFGYDNSFYHSILYPVLYRLAHPGWSPDIDYHVNEFYLLEGQKFSTSRRHAIWGKDVLGPHSVDAVRFFLSRTRPEGRRTNYEHDAYDRVLRDTLAGTWQRWLSDLGARVDKHHGGTAPEPGTWTPEHSAFLDRLGVRLSAVTRALGADGFSLNQAADELDGIVQDAVRFARQEGPVAESTRWSDQARTAIALELAAASLLAHCAAPVMPRFAGRLATALGLRPPAEWPRTVALIPSGTGLDLARQVFFSTPPDPAGGPDTPLLPWLAGLVRSTLQLPEDEPVENRSPAQLGMVSMQTVALQFQILEELGVDVSVEELLDGRDVTALAALLAERAKPEALTTLAGTVRI
jgi:methionyl-tRNA synthetase